MEPAEIEVAVLAAAMKHLHFEIDPDSLEAMDNDTASVVNKVMLSTRASVVNKVVLSTRPSVVNKT